MKLLDTTLREGTQRWGVYFDFKVKKEIICRLVELGVEELELGVVGEEKLKPLIVFAKELSSETKFSVWLRLKKEDIKKAKKFPEVGFNISVPVSEIQLQKKLRVKKEVLLKKIEQIISLASQYSPCVTLGLEDASRAEKSFLFQVAKIAISSGAKRIRISDTLGLFNPLEVGNLIKDFQKTFIEVEIGFHGHNDFGMATANAISALISGAHWVDVSILGLGERAGIASLEEVISYLYFQQNRKHYRIDLLPKIAHYVAKQVGESISEFRPIIGGKIFYCESGLHVDGLKKDFKTYEPFPPEILGLKRCYFLGAKSGKSAIKFFAEEWGIKIPETKLNQLIKKIRKKAMQLGRPLNQEEAKALLHFCLQECK